MFTFKRLLIYTIEYEQMMTILEEIGIDGKDWRLHSNLYWNQKITVKNWGEANCMDKSQERRKTRLGHVPQSVFTIQLNGNGRIILVRGSESWVCKHQQELGVKVTTEGRSKSEIVTRIGMA